VIILATQLAFTGCHHIPAPKLALTDYEKSAVSHPKASPIEGSPAGRVGRLSRWMRFRRCIDECS